MELRLLQQQHAELTTAPHHDTNALRTGWQIQTNLGDSGQKAIANARAALLNVDGSVKAGCIGKVI